MIVTTLDHCRYLVSLYLGFHLRTDTPVSTSHDESGGIIAAKSADTLSVTKQRDSG